MKKVLVSAFLWGFSLSMFAQSGDSSVWNLEKCIRHAEENNLQLKQQKLNSEIRKNIYSQSQFERLPSINAGGNYNYNMGRTVDRYTNEFSENNVQSTNFYLSADMNLFNGFQVENTIRKNKFDYMAALADNEKLKNDISLNIASAYLQILFNIEMLKTAENKLNLTKNEVIRIKNLTDAGKLAESNLLEIMASEAADELAKINAENQLKSSYLVLKQFLDLTPEDSFSIEIPIIENPENIVIPFTIEELYTSAQQLPQIKAADYRVKSYEKSLAVSRGRLLPRLSLTASYGTGYSDARKLYSLGTSVPVPVGYVEGSNATVYSLQPTYNDALYPFADQMKDNAAKSVGLQISIPIFNKRSVAADISNSKKYLAISNYNLQIEQNNLYKEIQTSYSDAESALSRFQSSKKAFEASARAFESGKSKFELGILSTADYSTLRNNLSTAESNLLQSKYEFVFRMAILNFYAGKPISIR